MRSTPTLLLVAYAALVAACTDTTATEPGTPSAPPAPGAPNGTPGTTPNGASNGGTSSSTVPTSLLGDWRAGTISMLSFWNSHTGDYVGAASGYSVFFSFQADGKYTMNVYFMTRSYGCVTEGWTELRGTAQFGANGTFVTHPTTGRYKGSDNCVARMNFDRAATSEELAGQRKTYYWSFETNATDGKTYLMLGSDPDARSYFQRVQ